LKKVSLIAAIFFGFAMFLIQPAEAGRYGNGSDAKDCLQIGVIKSIGNRQFTLETRFEKTAKTYSITMHPKSYVLTNYRGTFKHFTDLKKGDLVAAYGYMKDGKWQARQVKILDPNHYLVKRLAADAKAGVYFKHER